MLMSKRYLTMAGGNLSITQISGSDPGGDKLGKALFELSRTTDLTTNFDPIVHTRDTIAEGLEGHRPLSLVGECDASDLPADRYFRNAWEWRG